MIYDIFGDAVKVAYEDDKIAESLDCWLKYYPFSNKNNADINITFVKSLPEYKKEIYYSSPTSYKVYDNVVLMKIGKHEIVFDKKDVLSIYIKYNYKTNFIKDYLLKFRSIGYFNSLENIGAFFHEMILVLMQYILNEKMLIHSSAVKNLVTNEVILFGGSGGVGKTSLELLLCNELNYSFIADDISVVDKDGYVYPNLAFPKIYAYNIINNENIENKIFKNRDILDKLQWSLMRKIRGDKGIRRAISPFDLYETIERKKNKITSYYILQRTNKVDKITITDLDKGIASYATYLIIKNEYGMATQHFIWDEYNTLFDYRIKPIVVLDEVYENWKKRYETLFSKIDTYLIEIPVNIQHKDFINFFKNYFG